MAGAVRGRGLPAGEAIVVLEELGRLRSPELINFVAVEVIAPALMAFVDDERLTRWLPTMASAEEVWCQLFSEPDAGSDLSSLRTRAVPDGDGWLITGRKMWSTWGQFADLGLLLARTGTLESRHRGVSAFVIDMRQPGVEVRPLVTMTGAAEFAEVTFDEVPVASDRLVGEVDRGWAVALHMLANERGPYTRCGAPRCCGLRSRGSAPWPGAMAPEQGVRRPSMRTSPCGCLTGASPRWQRTSRKADRWGRTPRSRRCC